MTQTRRPVTLLCCVAIAAGLGSCALTTSVQAEDSKQILTLGVWLKQQEANAEDAADSAQQPVKKPAAQELPAAPTMPSRETT